MEILVGQAIFKLWIKTVKILFWSINQNRYAYWNFNAIFVSPELSSVRDYVITHSVRSMYVVYM